MGFNFLVLYISPECSWNYLPLAIKRYLKFLIYQPSDWAWISVGWICSTSFLLVEGVFLSHSTSNENWRDTFDFILSENLEECCQWIEDPQGFCAQMLSKSWSEAKTFLIFVICSWFSIIKWQVLWFKLDIYRSGCCIVNENVGNRMWINENI